MPFLDCESDVESVQREDAAPEQIMNHQLTYDANLACQTGGHRRAECRLGNLVVKSEGSRCVYKKSSTCAPPTLTQRAGNGVSQLLKETEREEVSFPRLGRRRISLSSIRSRGGRRSVR